MAQPLSKGPSVPLLTARTFTISMWTLCGVTSLLLASRFAIRMSTKGRLMINDYFLVAALPMLFAASALLQSVIDVLYSFENAASDANQQFLFRKSSATSRLTAAFEMLWIAVYSVKFCFLAQFKFYKAPFTYMDLRLTRYYWVAIVVCVMSFLYTLIQPIILCRDSGDCRYFDYSNTVLWEMALTAIDIVTDLLG